jgi:hypothetical protein
MLQLLYKLGNRKHITLVHKQKQTLSWGATMSWSNKQFLILLAKGTERIVLALENRPALKPLGKARYGRKVSYQLWLTSMRPATTPTKLYVCTSALQSLMIAVTMVLMHVVRLIPTSVIW